ncbi:MAG: hypothetical protein QOK16_3845 [Solirubrobacteraceae bacterium]|jgi:hypothetical protein|nr:hypothetical protein [Solirubrobacteraceae bacterium]
MEPSDEEFRDFLEAEKLVRVEARRARRPPNWSRSGTDAFVFRTPVEVAAVARGTVLVVINISLERHWNFKLLLGSSEVLLWHFTDWPCRHRNRGCPPCFPRRVTAREHEHRRVAGRGLDCAVPLRGLADATHEEVFAAFCKRARIVFELPYGGPVVGEQLTF